MDPGTALKASASLIAKIARWWAGRNDEGFKHERDELFRQWTAELALALTKNVGELERLEGEGAVGRRLDLLSSSKEFWRVLDNYGYEAAREAIDERRKMLAWAAAGSVSARLTVAQMARVERTLRELDPHDLVVLRQLHELAPTSLGDGTLPAAEALTTMQEKAKERHSVWLTTQPSGHILAAAGCLLVQDYNLDLPTGTATPFTFPTVVAVVTVTDLGRWVLAVTLQPVSDAGVASGSGAPSTS